MGKNKLNDLLKNTLSAWYQLPEDTVRHLFRHGVKAVYVGYADGEGGYGYTIPTLNWNEFTVPQGAGMVIEFNEGNLLSIDNFNGSIILCREMDYES